MLVLKTSRRLSLVLAGTCCVVIAALSFSKLIGRSTGADREQDNDKTAKAELLPIPDAWKRAPSGSAAGKDGYGWYRCAVKIPSNWKGKKIELFMEAVDDAREAYVNGTRVGGYGEFPPKFRSGLGGTGRFAVAAKSLRAGEVNTVAIRVYIEAARTNFNVAAPVLFAGDEAIRLAGKWEFRIGDGAKWGKGFGDSKPAAEIVYAKIDSADEVVRTLKKLTNEEGPLSVAETLKRITVPDDLRIDVVLAEPDIGQPLSIKWDERGRLWLVEYLQYPNPAGLKMVSRDKYLRSVYDKVPPAPPNHFKGADRITIHEDTNGDGRYDKHKTFVDGLSLVSSCAIGRGGVFVLNPPYLLFYPDKNKDDVPDGDPEVLLEGFGIEDSHSIANSLRWGLDGWLYACQGSTTTGSIRRPGSKETPVHSMGQLVWRYHPEKRKYEIFAEGGGNAFGLEIDSKGRIYSGHNGGDTRGFHYVQGGYFRKGFGKHGELSNPYAFGYFPHMPHDKVPRFTHNFVIYESTELPKQYHGRLFGVGPLQSHVVYSNVTTRGSSFQTKDLGHPLKSTDTWVRPVDIKVGPDGGLYVADLYEQRIDHASHYQGRVHKTSGRIYRLVSKDAKQPAKFDLGKNTGQELLTILQHHNKWFRKEALRLIADRHDESLVPHISLNAASGQEALDRLWALNLSGGLTDGAALKALEHDDPFVRLWTVRLLCDQQRVSRPIAKMLTALAETEPNVEARCQLACSAKRLPAADALPIVRNLLARSEDTGDPYIPLLLWWVIESKCESDGKAVVELFRDDSIWDLVIVRDHILERLMRRFAQAGRRADLLACAELLSLAPKPEHAKRLLAGFEKAYEGRALAKLPETLVAAIAKSGGGSLALRLRQSDPKAITDALKIIEDEKADTLKRIQYVRIFGQINQKQSVPKLLKLAQQSSNAKVRSAALSALQSFDDPQIGIAVVESYTKLPPEALEAGQSLLASRRSWSLELLKAIDAKKIPSDAVPMPIVRRILLHQDKSITELVNKHFGSVQGATTEQMLREIERLKSLLAEASGNPYVGKRLYMQSCGKCHVLYGQGGYVGPDLTSFKRDDLHRMILNVVNPSIEIREGFESYVVYTQDGRVLNGFIADQDNQVVELRGVDGQSTIIPRDEIEEMRAVPQSVMPEGVLKNFDDEQIRDLFAYLRSTQPLP